MAKAVRRSTTKSAPKRTKAKRLMPIEATYTKSGNFKILLVPGEGPDEEEVRITLSATSGIQLVNMIVSLVNARAGQAVSDVAKAAA